MDKNSIPLINVDTTIERLEGVELFRNFMRGTFNEYVKQCFYKNSPEHSIARKTLLITEKDTQISIANKQLAFWFTLQKFTQEREEKILIGKGFAIKDDEDYSNIYAKVRLVPRNKFVDGRNSGYRYIQIPHIDPAKLGNLRDFTFTFGREVLTYTFADKRKIKVKALTREIGHKTINKLLDLVLDDWKVGTSEEHSAPATVPNDIPDGDLHGRIANGTHLLVYNHGGSAKYEILL
jgi:hypothetical protein